MAADAMGETGKGFGIFIMVVGIIETVALMGLVFFMRAIRRASKTPRHDPFHRWFDRGWAPSVQPGFTGLIPGVLNSKPGAIQPPQGGGYSHRRE